jgi:hypothetical protein
MKLDEVNKLIKLMKSKQVDFEIGLTDNEILQVENKFDILLPPDLKLFLKTELPISENFVNWRLGLKLKDEADKIFDRLNWPLEGMLFDLQSNEFWIKSWGCKPNNYKEKERIAKEKYSTFPKLIPIYSHRYIPSRPNEEGNPVFSVHQMDIIYYGYDLATYFANEFNFKLTSEFKLLDKPNREIDFWTKWVEEEWMEN